MPPVDALTAATFRQTQARSGRVLTDVDPRPGGRSFWAAAALAGLSATADAQGDPVVARVPHAVPGMVVHAAVAGVGRQRDLGDNALAQAAPERACAVVAALAHRIEAAVAMEQKADGVTEGATRT